MLMPKKVKYRKQQKGKRRGKAWRGSEVTFGEYGLKALEAGWVTDRQIEAGRVAITRFIKRGGKIWIRVFPDKPITKKPAETRMGKGKGAPEGWVAVVRPGKILYEMEGVSRGTRPGSHAAGRQQAVGQGEIRQAVRQGGGMKASKMRDMSREDLVQEDGELRQQLFKLRFQTASGQLESASRVRSVRRDIARIQTILREMQLEEERKQKVPGKAGLK